MVATLVDAARHTPDNALLAPVYGVKLVSMSDTAMYLRGWELEGEGRSTQVVLQDWLGEYV